MKRWQNCVAVVTGASSGIGEACARDLVKAGLRVVALARRIEKLEENRLKLPADCQDRFYTRKCDITVENDVKKTFEWIEDTQGGTDVLVNNAGCKNEGNLLEMDTKLMEEVWKTNVSGLIYCTQAAFRSMKRRNFPGHLVHISSVAGRRVVYFGEGLSSLNIYQPTKFAVTAINEVIRIELNNYGSQIKTTSIHPGYVKTDKMPQHPLKQLNAKYLYPSDVSSTVLFAISTPPNVLIPDLTVKAMGELFQ